MVTRWCDTSALLHQPGLLDPQAELAISPLTINELEHIKSSTNYTDKVKYQAREAVRHILTDCNFEVVTLSHGKSILLEKGDKRK